MPRLGVADAVDPVEVLVEELEEALGVGQERLDHDVEAAGDVGDVGDVLHLRQLAAHLLDAAPHHPDADHGVDREADGGGVDARRDDDRPGVHQAVDALAHGRLGDAHRARDLRVGEAPVVAQQLHDPAVEVVQRHGAVGHRALADTGLLFGMRIAFALHW